MTMYDELQQIIAPNTLSSFEFTKLEELLKDYTEEQILNAYKKVGYKPINYITKILSNKNTITAEWLNKEIKNQKIDNEVSNKREVVSLKIEKKNDNVVVTKKYNDGKTQKTKR